MEKYLLISVFEREIMAEIFDTIEDAQNAMRREYNDHAREEQLENVNGDEWFIGTRFAYITDGINHDNYDWQICKIKIDIKTELR